LYTNHGNLEAYDYFLRGDGVLLSLHQEAQYPGRQMWEKAVELAPYAEAYAFLGFTYWAEWFYQWSPDPQKLARAFALSRRPRPG